MNDKRGAGEEEESASQAGHELVAAHAKPLSAARTPLSLPCLLLTVSLRFLTLVEGIEGHRRTTGADLGAKRDSVAGERRRGRVSKKKGPHGGVSFGRHGVDKCRSKVGKGKG